MDCSVIIVYYIYYNIIRKERGVVICIIRVFLNYINIYF